MLLEISKMTGMRPCLSTFGLPPQSASSCQNVKFENGCIVPLAEYHFALKPPSTKLPGLELPDLIDNSVGDFLSILDSSEVIRPSIQVIKPNYIKSVTGSQTVWVWFDGRGAFDRMLTSTTPLFPEYGLLRDRTGYTISIDPVPRELGTDYVGSVPITSVKTQAYVHKLYINGKSMQPRPTAFISDPLFPSGSLVLTSSTNHKPVTLTISANALEMKAPNFRGNGYLPKDNPHISGSFYVKVQETYSFSGTFKFKFSVLNDSGEVIFTSRSSESEFMDVGDGIYVYIPRIVIVTGTDRVDLNANKYIKLYRSLNSGAYKEVGFVDTVRR